MVLTDREIEIALANKHIIVEPIPNLKEALSSTTLDLTLSNVFVRWKEMPGHSIHPGAKGFKYANTSVFQERLEQDSYTLNPGKFILAWTAEYISLPEISRIAARVEGKSTLARLGVGVHVTAPTIHSGFEGNIQLEMFNHGVYDIVLDRGMRVCQLIFEQTYGTPNKGYLGSFTGQKPGV